MSLRMRKRYLMGMKGLMTLPLDRCSDMCVDLWHSGINPERSINKPTHTISERFNTSTFKSGSSNPTPEIQEQGAT